MTDSGGSIRARYDYDPYGRRTKLSGDLETDFAFTGQYRHLSTGLQFTLCRVYDPDNGMWLSRDPLGELGGMNEPKVSAPGSSEIGDPLGTPANLNLYAYVAGNPLNLLDPLGLFSWSCFGKGVASGILWGAATVVVAGLAVGLGAPLAAVTIGLAVVGGVGLVTTALSMISNPSEGNLSYNAGALTG